MYTALEKRPLTAGSTFRSTMRRATDLRRSECGIVSKCFDNSVNNVRVAPALAKADVRPDPVVLGRAKARGRCPPTRCAGARTERPQPVERGQR
jgi:hypothetical protein